MLLSYYVNKPNTSLNLFLLVTVFLNSFPTQSVTKIVSYQFFNGRLYISHSIIIIEGGINMIRWKFCFLNGDLH